jgi:hypothetical protein
MCVTARRKGVRRGGERGDGRLSPSGASLRHAGQDRNVTSWSTLLGSGIPDVPRTAEKDRAAARRVASL